MVLYGRVDIYSAKPSLCLHYNIALKATPFVNIYFSFFFFLRTSHFIDLIMTTYYEVLGVSETASLDLIKQRFHQLILQVRKTCNKSERVSH